jgi:uncharacterized protein (TIRG00374 family)
MPRFGAKLVKIVITLAYKLKIVKEPKKIIYKITKTLIRNSQCVKKTFKKPLLAIACFLVSFLEHFAYLSIAYFTLKIFGFNSHMAEYDPFLEWLQIIQLVLLLNTSVSFIPTPGNSGAADLSFYLLFTSGLAGGLTFPAMTIWRIFAFYSFIIIGFIFATLKKRSDKRKRRKLA